MGTVLGKSRAEKVSREVSLMASAASAFKSAPQQNKNGEGNTVPESGQGDDGAASKTENKENAARSNIQNGSTTPRKSPRKSVTNDTEVKAVTKIQSMVRGHQARQQRQKENEMATKIQKQFRKKQQKEKIEPQRRKSIKPEVKDSDEAESEALKKRHEERILRPRPWREDIPGMEENYEQLSKELQENFHAYQNEIDIVKWQSEQYIEQGVMSGTPLPRVLLISSNVPKGNYLLQVAKENPNIIVIQYNFQNGSYDDIIETVKQRLTEYKPECKARSICIYCMGTPGCLYLLYKRCCSSAKLKKGDEQDMVKFWKDMGTLMSKIPPISETIIHVMGCNILGQPTGEMLFQEIEELVKPNIVRLQAPLELSPSGKIMIETYFDFKKYKTWKTKRNTLTSVIDLES
ncbi:NMDA receptor synaptonuclear signaling and neuronal migration factor-like [Ptychodera flava]|uniref:NMDA receptor synaptonuclear signaling and neuronal migration factor-like n=1 Tax=Ptychodera flava TaxID=63121 RepID=UPI00396A85CB